MTASPARIEPVLRRRAVLIAWIAAVAVDFGLHAGILAPAYDWSSPFLLEPVEAFMRIPAGYLAFLVFVAGLAWLLPLAGVRSARSGLAAAAGSGAIAGGAFLVGLWSIATAEPQLLFAWWIGLTIQFSVAGWVIGACLGGATTSWVVARTAVAALAAMALAILLQALGYARAPGIAG